MMKRFLGLAVLLAISVSAQAALPTAAEVQAEVQQGHYQQAETMMHEVVTAKPDNAKGHYLYAELLAHNARFDQAAQEARRARELDPQIHFTQPEKFSAFVQLLDREQATARANANAITSPRAMGMANGPAAMPAERSSGIPGWVWPLGLMLVAIWIWRRVSARQQQVVMSPGMVGGGTAYGPAGAYAQGGMPMGMGPSGGSGMLGTGMAAAGGLAAGMLLERVLDDRQGGSMFNSGMGGGMPANFGGTSMDNSAADALEDRSVDFGSGDSWGGDDSGGGGMDMGGGDSW